MTQEKLIRYEIVYTDFSGVRSRQSYIKTLEEAKRRVKKYYTSKECKAIVNKVVEVWKYDTCISISRRKQKI